jgi:hypothetical protein
MDTSDTAVDVREVIERVHNLNSKEKLHILNILKIHNKSFTKNANGYFFNMYDIENNVLEKIYKCLELIEENRDVINEMDKRRDELLAYYKQVIHDKINASLSKLKQEYTSNIMLKPSKNNIEMCYTRIRRINRYESSSNDPDVLLKEYVQKQTISKNSIFFRMKARMKEMSTGKIRYKRDTNDDVEETADFAYQDPDHLEHEPDTDQDLEPEPEIDNDNDDEDNAFNEDDTGEGDDDVDNEDDDDEGASHDGDTEEREREIMFYKKILNNSGFVFDEDIRCNLVYQEYIH